MRKVDVVCWEQRFLHGCGDCKHYGNRDSLGICSECLHGKECRFERKEEE